MTITGLYQSVHQIFFENCLLSKLSKFLATSSNQFGFKEASSCGHAIFCVRKVVGHYAANGSTVNVCSLDLSKAFDKIDHYAFYLKLMDRSIPVKILDVLGNWLSLCLSLSLIHISEPTRPY